MSQEINMKNFEILEEGPQMSQDENTSFQILAEGPQVSQDLNMTNLQILEEGPRVCPLCSQEIRLYFINYNEKVEMCENLECDYPFGYKPLKIVQAENEIDNFEVKSVSGRGSCSIACSQASSQSWSDVDKLCNIFESEDVSSINLSKLNTAAQLVKTDSDRRKEELLKNVEKIKRMTKNMNEMKKDSKSIIRNEKWIKNLQYLQGLSGINLLKPAEMKSLKKKAPVSRSGELKIDIDKNNLTSIRIEVNQTTSRNTETI